MTTRFIGTSDRFSSGEISRARSGRLAVPPTSRDYRQIEHPARNYAHYARRGRGRPRERASLFTWSREHVISVIMSISAVPLPLPSRPSALPRNLVVAFALSVFRDRRDPDSRRVRGMHATPRCPPSTPRVLAVDLIHHVSLSSREEVFILFDNYREAVRRRVPALPLFPLLGNRLRTGMDHGGH